MPAADAVWNAVENVGLPVALVLAAVVLGWRLGGAILRELVASYRERITGLEADRDYLRARDDRMHALCHELINECRARGRHEHDARD